MRVRGVPTALAPCLVVVAVAFGFISVASAQVQEAPGGGTGPSTFRLYCATCHGAAAKGDGPMASSMRVRPADLTQISRRNRGSFPTDQVAQIIDGRSPVKGHGGGDMPVWGDAFGKSMSQTPADARIRGLVLYLESIQAKP